MGFSEEAILQWFGQFAQQPNLVYISVVGFMLASSFGLPVPEEVVLVSAGFVGYMSLQAAEAAHTTATVDVPLLATICFLAVFLSDFLVFSLGRHLGSRFLDSRYMVKHKERMEEVSNWAKKYGAFAAGIFRFTPGLRFPGHFSCGMLGLPKWKFIAVDGTAALLTVPTQVLLVAHYGKEIMEYFSQFKMVLIALAAIGLVVWFIRKRRMKKLAH